MGNDKAHAADGRLEEAIRFSEKALGLPQQDTESRAALQRRLDGYRQGEAYRE